LEALSAYEHAKDMSDAIRAKKISDTYYNNIAQLIIKHKLPYESMTSVIGNNESCWTALLEVAPYFNMIRNLNNFVKYKAINQSNVDKVCSRIMDRTAIKKSMMYPFRFFQAVKNFDDTPVAGYGYHPYIGTFEFVEDPIVKKKIRNALINAMELSLDNMPSLPGKTMIMTDCSGSMSGVVNNDKTDISCIEVAGLYSAVFHKKSNANTVLLPFDTDLRSDVLQNVIQSKTLYDAAKSYTAGGGTALAIPMIYLLDRNIKVDNIVGFTDDMDWCSKSWGGQSMQFAEAFATYKKKVNPKVKAYLVTLMGYQGNPVPPEFNDVTFVYGWSDKIVDLIGKNMNEQIEKVRSLEI
jgi:60 kDa SS-A/Ro ribonucleoprotein